MEYSVGGRGTIGKLGYSVWWSGTIDRYSVCKWETKDKVEFYKVRCSRMALSGSCRFRPDMGCVLYRWDLQYPTVAIMIFRITESLVFYSLDEAGRGRVGIWLHPPLPGITSHFQPRREVSLDGALPLHMGMGICMGGRRGAGWALQSWVVLDQTSPGRPWRDQPVGGRMLFI